MKILNTVYSIYWDSTRPARLVTILLYPLAAFGLYWSRNSAGSDAELMMQIAPWWVWWFVVVYIFANRFLSLFASGHQASRIPPILGVVFWSMLLAANIWHTEKLSVGALYAVAALIEGWILSRAWLES